MPAEELAELAALLRLRREAQMDVRTIEAVDEDPGLPVEQALDDVFAGPGIRGRGERDDLRPAHGVGRLADLAVFGAEIMAPFADAMGFVDREAAQLCLAQPLDQPLGHQ